MRSGRPALRWALWFAVAGAALKVALIVAFRLTGSAGVFAWVVRYDPVSVWLAETAVAWLFDQRRIAPPASEALAFEAFLVLGCAVQCAALGTAVHAVRAWSARRARRG
jgi:hypothetical protein